MDAGILFRISFSLYLTLEILYMEVNHKKSFLTIQEIFTNVLSQSE